MPQKLKACLAKNIPFFFGAPVFIWQVLFFVLPLLFIIALSVITRVDGHYVIGIKRFVTFFTPVYMRIIARSLVLALTNAILCLVLSYPIAYFLAFKAGKLKNVLLFFLIVPFWTNFLLHIYAWFFVLERGGFLNTVLLSLGVIQEPLHILNTMIAVGIMMVYYYLPFMALPLYAVLEKFDARLIEASSDLGATWWQTFYKIIVPLSMPGIVSGFFLVYVPSFAEFAIPELMGGNKKMFVGSVVSYDVLGGTTLSQGAAFTLLSAVILMISALVIFWCLRKLVKLV